MPGEGEIAVNQRLRILAIVLMVSAAVNIPALVLVLALNFGLEWVNTPGQPGMITVGVMTAATLVGAIIMLGGWHMLMLRSYGWAVAGSALALLPLSAGFMLGLPMGIWALIDTILILAGVFSDKQGRKPHNW